MLLLYQILCKVTWYQVIYTRREKQKTVDETITPGSLRRTHIKINCEKCSKYGAFPKVIKEVIDHENDNRVARVKPSEIIMRIMVIEHERIWKNGIRVPFIIIGMITIHQKYQEKIFISLLCPLKFFIKYTSCRSMSA